MTARTGDTDDFTIDKIVHPASQPPVIAIVGPTGVGKSPLAMVLARDLDADIICADSRQVYRYMDICTEKPTLQDRQEIHHFMLDLVEPDDMYSAQRFSEEGRRVLAAIKLRGRTALVVGGTGFYIQALLDGFAAPAVPPNPSLRSELREKAATDCQFLHARLRERDPNSARRIHPNNTPRLIRALEIVEGLGGPVPSSLPCEPIAALYVGLTMDREALRRRVDERVLAQVRRGLVEETHSLLAMGFDPESPAMSGLGYREMISFLGGETSLDEAIARYQAATRRYIRRQFTWFRQDQRILWLEAGDRVADEARRLAADWLARA